MRPARQSMPSLRLPLIAFVLLASVPFARSADDPKMVASVQAMIEVPADCATKHASCLVHRPMARRAGNRQLLRYAPGQ